MMLTGDSALTALHVARETSVAVSAPAAALVLGDRPLQWTDPYADDKPPVPFVAADMPRLAESADLVRQPPARQRRWIGPRA